jgi:hypothetical protein
MTTIGQGAVGKDAQSQACCRQILTSSYLSFPFLSHLLQASSGCIGGFGFPLCLHFGEQALGCSTASHPSLQTATSCIYNTFCHCAHILSPAFDREGNGGCSQLCLASDFTASGQRSLWITFLTSPLCLSPPPTLPSLCLHCSALPTF